MDDALKASSSARRTWIEIMMLMLMQLVTLVVLRTEDVD